MIISFKVFKKHLCFFDHISFFQWLNHLLTPSFPLVSLFTPFTPPPKKKHLQYALFEADYRLRCSHRVGETRALHPQGDCTEFVIQIRNSAHLKVKNTFFCFSCFTTFFLTTASRGNMIVLRCSRLSPSPNHPIRPWKLSQAW